MKLNLEAPFNNLSFGNCSYNFAQQLYEKGVEVNIFPIGGNFDISAFAPDQDFVRWLESSANGRFKNYDNRPTLKLWHINGAESCVGYGKKFLYTFYECDSPTSEELNIVQGYDKVIFSSDDSKSKFKLNGSQNATSIPIGFDKSFKVLNKKYFDDSITHWVLCGKLEKRKNTERLIRIWLSKFANNPSHKLTCLINNQFMPKEQMSAIREQIKNIAFNTQALDFLKTNAEMNDFYNSADIDLTGLSSAEGHNIPAFMVTALGGWSIVMNHTGHKEWATKDNCILVEPESMRPIYDNLFFKEGQPFNQGNCYDVSDETIGRAMDLAFEKKGLENIEGLKLQESMSYSKTVDRILKEIQDYV